MDFRTRKGESFPLGATVQQDGVNFCLFSKNCKKVELLLFDHKDAPQPSQVIALDPATNRTFYYWHVFVEGIGHGQVYAYRVYGTYDSSRGFLFDGKKVLNDPYAKVVYMGNSYSRADAKILGKDNCATALRSVVIDLKGYDWAGDRPLHRTYSDTVIYEMHVGGFTKHPSSGLPNEVRGTYRGLIEKIPYLKELGITAVELLPVYQFDPQDSPTGLSNYWGYSPISFFAPHQGFAHGKAVDSPINEFRDMVKALHREGIEVILDVVYNHTSENDLNGPTLSYRGIENKAYYIIDQNGQYRDFSGCGNTFSANHSIVRRMILDSLRFWVTEMHVDGFRFDLASILSRGENGDPISNPPVLWEIESDPVLAGTKIIAEAWDAGGLYQVGAFIGDKWAEWNGKYRDEVRGFVKGDHGLVNRLSLRMEGSPDIYVNMMRDPNRSINFICCHDGFTMNDAVSYNQKHNLANGEDNRDGPNYSLSWNCGEEGPSQNETVGALRKRQIKNFFSILFLSQGTPMFLMGDEVRRTQQGNNNAYCQDNELSWFNWNDVEANADILRFVKHMIRFNLNHRLLQENYYWHLVRNDDTQRISWHGTDKDHPDFGHHSLSIAFMLTDREGEEQVYVIINAFWEPLDFELPDPVPEIGTHWVRVVDTYLPSPHDFTELDKAPVVKEKSYTAQPRSVVMLHVK